MAAERLAGGKLEGFFMNGWEHWVLGAALVVLGIGWLTVIAALWWHTGGDGEDEEPPTVEAQSSPPDERKDA